MKDISSPLAKVKDASRTLITLDTAKIDEVLNAIADTILKNQETILKANQKDLSRMKEDDPKYDRLKLTADRLEGIANDMKNVASLPSPLGINIEERDLESGIHLQKVSVPIGVIGIIYEARPNVTFDAFSLSFKSGNACALKGGSDAADSNAAEVELIQSVLKDHGIDPNVVHLLPPERAAVKALLEATEYVDIIIPRGSQSLINFVRENAKVPTIETGAGIVHVYVDTSADIEKARKIVENSKTKRPSVCNALDCLIVHRDRLSDLPTIMQDLAGHGVEVFADEESYAVLDTHYDAKLLQKATDESFGIEFLSLKMSIKTVNDLEEALSHIAKYSSKHSEAIVAEDEKTVDEYLKRVDAACVYSNASTYFTDGAQFGLGAEIGISTQKLHARGPMALREMTSYKWVLRGDGQIRN
jgi:glutamate-5-semialdehyde dehydrogenase